MQSSVTIRQRKKRRFDVITLILVLILLAGIIMIVYPAISNYRTQQKAAEAAAVYVQSVEGLNDEAYDQMLSDAQAYNEALAAKANQWELTEEDNALYESLLDPGAIGVMGTLEIPSINVSLPIYHGVSNGVLRIGVGHLEGTSLPIGGTGTHAVLSGHRGLTSAKLFTDLDKLVEGDLFYIQILNETLVYEVDQILIVEPEDTSALAIDPEQDYVTLMTCTPYGINTHRLLVRGHRIDPDEDGVVIATGEASVVNKILVAPFIAVPVLLVIVIFIIVRTRRRHSRSSA